MPEKKKLYVGCGLTYAPEAFKDQVEELKDQLSDDWEVMKFLGLTASTEIDVYRKDILENVDGCDAFVGICDEPSIGLGWELSRAVDSGKPTLGLAHASSKVTRLVLGAPAFNPHFSFRRYEDLVEDVPAIVLEEFEVVRSSLLGR